MITTRHDSSAIEHAVSQLRTKLGPVETETIPLLHASGRILAQTISLDRPSPPCHISAMDGYALRAADASMKLIPVRGIAAAGAPPIDLITKSAAKIFTGAPVPPQADCVIPREFVRELNEHIEIPDNLTVKSGQHIRRAGENASAGFSVAAIGDEITPVSLGAIAACGYADIKVFQKIRLGILISGNEIAPAGRRIADWQLRDSNGPMLHSMFGTVPWITISEHRIIADDPATTREMIAAALQTCDALLITGGVSAGDYDYIPAALIELGVETIFHRLPIKPGRPILCGKTVKGQFIGALPGNPVSSAVTARRFAAAALRRMSGGNMLPVQRIKVQASNTRAEKLTVFHLVRMQPSGSAEILKTAGSGDWVAAASSSGFVEIPPQMPPVDEADYYPWNL